MRHTRNDGNNLTPPVLIHPNIGLDSSARLSVVEILNITLADEVVLTTKTRGAHWNVRGVDFFELHALFENQYQLLLNISDEIAERVRMLGGLAIGSLSEFLRLSRLDEQPGRVPNLLRLLSDHEISIRFIREDARKVTEEYEDEGTFELLVSVMRQHEKIAWMLRSYIGAESLNGKNLVVV